MQPLASRALRATAFLAAASIACRGPQENCEASTSADPVRTTAAERAHILDSPAEAVSEGLAREWRSQASPDGLYTVFWRPADGEDIPKNEEFALEVKLEKNGAPVSGAALAVRGWMPDHQHGMARQPRVTELGGGRYRVDGMLLHMRGHWQLFFDVTDDSAHATFAFDLELP